MSYVTSVFVALRSRIRTRNPFQLDEGFLLIYACTTSLYPIRRNFGIFSASRYSIQPSRFSHPTTPWELFT
jgi:hypothetical protein